MMTPRSRQLSPSAEQPPFVMRLGSRVPLGLFLFVALLIASEVIEWPLAIRFTHAPLNYWAAGLLALAAPLSVVFLGRTFTRPLWRRFTTTVGFVSFFPMFLFFAAAIYGSRNPHQAADFQLRNSLPVGSATYRVYLDAGGGAFFPPFIVLRQEYDTNFGVKFVRSIWTDSRYDEVLLRVVDGTTLEVVSNGATRVKLAI